MATVGEIESGIAKSTMSPLRVASFYDREAIDGDMFCEIQSPSPAQDDVWFVPVKLRPGQLIGDVIKVMSREELMEIAGYPSMNWCESCGGYHQEAAHTERNQVPMGHSDCADGTK